MTRTKVTIVSSDREHLDQIARSLSRHPELGDIARVEGGARALSEIRDAPDVLVINGALAEDGGLDVVERLGHAHPDTAVIVVSQNQTADFLMRAMRAGVREVVPLAAAEEEVCRAISRVKKRHGSGAADGKIVAFMSCKGGAGATFLATNCGYALAGAESTKVALIDLNLQWGDAALFVSEQRPATDVAQLAREIHRLDASLLTASMLNVLPNYAVLPAPDDPAHAVDVTPKHVETLLSLARRLYSHVIVDLGRSLDAVSLQVLDMADIVFPVMQVSLPCVRDAKRLIGVLRSLGYSKSKVKLLVNRYEKGGELSLADVESALGMAAFRTIPNSYSTVAASVNQGVPVVKLARNDPVSKSVNEFAGTLAPPAGRTDTSWLSRMLGRA